MMVGDLASSVEFEANIVRVYNRLLEGKNVPLRRGKSLAAKDKGSLCKILITCKNHHYSTKQCASANRTWSA